MIEILRDSIWQFIGAVIAFIGVLAAVIFYLLQRSRKSLAYQVISSTKILTVNEEYQGKLEIVYEGTPVQNATLCVLKLVNDGNVPIASADYEQPLSLGFGSACNILSAEIIETSPKTLKPLLRVEATRFYLEPLLLNKKDSLTVKLLIAQYNDIIEPEARIIGIREVTQARERNYVLGLIPFVVGIALILIVSDFDLLTTIVFTLMLVLTTAIVVSGAEVITRLNRRLRKVPQNS